MLWGRIQTIDLELMAGTIKGEDDGKIRYFRRDGLMFPTQFLDLKPGNRVLFDVSDDGLAIHVELAQKSREI